MPTLNITYSFIATELSSGFAAHQQFKPVDSDTSSPTLSTEALFISAAIDAQERRYVITVDIEGAYLHADIESEVIMEISPELAAMLGESYPDVYKSFFDSRGRLYVQLDKDALYGCVESAKLFSDHLSKSLTSMGFVKNPYDHCVLNFVMYNKQCTVTVHVDDLKISCADRRGVVADTVNCLKRIYKRLNCHEKKVLDYLGTDFDYRSPGQVKISMVGMVDEALDEYELEGSAKTPACRSSSFPSERGQSSFEEGRQRKVSFYGAETARELGQISLQL